MHADDFVRQYETLERVRHDVVELRQRLDRLPDYPPVFPSEGLATEQRHTRGAGRHRTGESRGEAARRVPVRADNSSSAASAIALTAAGVTAISLLAHNSESLQSGAKRAVHAARELITKGKTVPGLLWNSSSPVHSSPVSPVSPVREHGNPEEKETQDRKAVPSTPPVSSVPIDTTLVSGPGEAKTEVQQPVLAHGAPPGAGAEPVLVTQGDETEAEEDVGDWTRSEINLMLQAQNDGGMNRARNDLLQRGLDMDKKADQGLRITPGDFELRDTDWITQKVRDIMKPGIITDEMLLESTFIDWVDTKFVPRWVYEEKRRQFVDTRLDLVVAAEAMGDYNASVRIVFKLIDQFDPVGDEQGRVDDCTSAIRRLDGRVRKYKDSVTELKQQVVEIANQLRSRIGNHEPFAAGDMPSVLRYMQTYAKNL